MPFSATGPSLSWNLQYDLVYYVLKAMLGSALMWYSKDRKATGECQPDFIADETYVRRYVSL